MPKYLVIARTFLRAPTDFAPRIYEAGDEVEFDGLPGTSLAALDEAARSAKDRAALLHQRGAAAHAARAERRNRAHLTRPVATRLAAADAQLRRA